MNNGKDKKSWKYLLQTDITHAERKQNKKKQILEEKINNQVNCLQDKIIFTNNIIDDKNM